MIHQTSHELAGQTVTLRHVSKKENDLQNGAEYKIEDYWDRLTGETWMKMNVWATVNYAKRSVGLPPDNEVIYGKISGLGYLVHVTEL